MVLFDRQYITSYYWSVVITSLTLHSIFMILLLQCAWLPTTSKCSFSMAQLKLEITIIHILIYMETYTNYYMPKYGFRKVWNSWSNLQSQSMSLAVVASTDHIKSFYQSSIVTTSLPCIISKTMSLIYQNMNRLPASLHSAACTLPPHYYIVDILCGSAQCHYRFIQLQYIRIEQQYHPAYWAHTDRKN